MISSKKDRRYVQTDSAMQTILVDRGLENARLRPMGSDDETASLGGDRLQILHDLVVSIDHSLRTFGRRNLPLRAFLGKKHGPEDPKLDGLLPLYLVKEGADERPLNTAEEFEAYRQSQIPTPAADEPESPAETAGEPGTGGPEAETSGPDNVIELHEVRSLNKSLARLR